MAKIAVLFGVLLFLVGAGGYAYSFTGTPSLTAWIPAIPGVFLIAFGAIGLAKPNLNKHMMHTAIIFAFLGALAPIGGLKRQFSAEEINPVALGGMFAMMFLCLAFVVLCVISFMKARKARKAEAAEIAV